MSKVKKAFFCQNCGYESVKWIGQCPSCNQWNSFVEEIIQKEPAKNNGWEHYHETSERTNKTIQLNEIKNSEEKRLLTTDDELNRVLVAVLYQGVSFLWPGSRELASQLCFYKMG